MQRTRTITRDPRVTTTILLVHTTIVEHTVVDRELQDLLTGSTLETHPTTNLVAEVTILHTELLQGKRHGGLRSGVEEVVTRTRALPAVLGIVDGTIHVEVDILEDNRLYVDTTHLTVTRVTREGEVHRAGLRLITTILDRATGRYRRVKRRGFGIGIGDTLLPTDTEVNERTILGSHIGIRAAERKALRYLNRILQVVNLLRLKLEDSTLGKVDVVGHVVRQERIDTGSLQLMGTGVDVVGIVPLLPLQEARLTGIALHADHVRIVHTVPVALDLVVHTVYHIDVVRLQALYIHIALLAQLLGKGDTDRLGIRIVARRLNQDLVHDVLTILVHLVDRLGLVVELRILGQVPTHAHRRLGYILHPEALGNAVTLAGRDTYLVIPLTTTGRTRNDRVILVASLREGLNTETVHGGILQVIHTQAQHLGTYNRIEDPLLGFLELVVTVQTGCHDVVTGAILHAKPVELDVVARTLYDRRVVGLRTRDTVILDAEVGHVLALMIAVLDALIVLGVVGRTSHETYYQRKAEEQR